MGIKPVIKKREAEEGKTVEDIEISRNAPWGVPAMKKALSMSPLLRGMP